MHNGVQKRPLCDPKSSVLSFFMSSEQFKMKMQLWYWLYKLHAKVLMFSHAVAQHALKLNSSHAREHDHQVLHELVEL